MPNTAVDTAAATPVTAFPKRHFPAIHRFGGVMRCRAIFQSQ